MKSSDRTRGNPEQSPPVDSPSRVQSGHTPGTSGQQHSDSLEGGTRPADSQSVAPRLLDVQAAADYLSVSTWTIRDLEAAGELCRVRLPLPGHGEVRRLLFDRHDLDRFVD